MSKSVYCSECGMKLPVTLKALKGYGKVIKLVEPHECTEEPMPIDLEPVEIPKAPEGKFVQNLNELSVIGSVGTGDLRDSRAPEHVKSTAPASLLSQIKSIHNTQPEGDIGKDPEGN